MGFVSMYNYTYFDGREVKGLLVDDNDPFLDVRKPVRSCGWGGEMW